MTRYIYRCAACGNAGEIDFPDASHEGEAATCPAPCCEPVTLARDTSSLFWLEGGEDSFEPPRPPFEPGQALYELQWLYELIDGANVLKPGRVVIPRKAAVALCGGDHREADPLSGVTAAMRDAHETLLDRFENTDPKVDRTLADWWAIAKAKGLAYHPHIDALMLAHGFGQASDEAADPANALPPRYQVILNAIAKLGYKATALPRGKQGLRGVRAEVRDELAKSNGFKLDAFEDDWQDMRTQGLTGDAPSP